MVLRLDITGEIGVGTCTADRLVALIEDAGDEAIVVRIDSQGGGALPALRIHDALVAYPGPVATVVAGRAASAAVVIALAGHARSIAAGACFEFHAPHMGDCSGMAGLDAVGLREWAAALDEVEDRIVDVIVSNTRLNADTARVWMTGQRCVDADAAVHHGLVDEIVGDLPPAVAAAPRARFGAINSRHTSFRPVMTAPPLFAVGQHTYASGTRVRHADRVWMAQRDMAAIVVNAPGVGRGWRQVA